MDIFSISTTSHSPTGEHLLAKLPKYVREIIYANLQLPRGRFLNLHFPGHKTHPRPMLGSADYPDLNVMRSLMLTCRTISDHVSEYVYRQNTLVLLLGNENDAPHAALDSLAALRPTTVRAMTRLVVSLGRDCCEGCFCNHHDWELNSGPVPNAMIAKWQMIWREHLAPYIQPGRLTMDFRCDTSEFQDALSAIMPFTNGRAHIFRDLNIRLGRRQEDLMVLAEEVVEHAAQSKYTPKGIFRFMELPPEIRLRILEFTDLICPVPEVNYTIGKGFWFEPWVCLPRLFSQSYHGEPCLLPEHDHYPGGEDTGDVQDQVPRGAIDIEGEEYGCRFINCARAAYPACGFCKTEHAAASSQSFCYCWTPPTSLFLVCRSLYCDAARTFYQHNRICIHADSNDLVRFDNPDRPRHDTFNPYLVQPLQRLHPATFIRQVVPRFALKYLRSLEFVFPPFGHEDAIPYAECDSHAWQDWLEAIEILYQEADLSRLTLRVFFQEYLDFEQSRISFYRYLTLDQEEAMRNACQEIVKPLARLRGLHRFFVRLPRLATHSDYYRQWWLAHDSIWNLSPEIKQDVHEKCYLPARAMECTVMGPGYNSDSSGRETDRVSRWYKRSLLGTDSISPCFKVTRVEEAEPRSSYEDLL